MVIIDRYKRGNHRINPALLWEYDMNAFDWNASKSIVVQRVVELGEPEDYYGAFDLYGGIDNFVEVLKSVPYLSPIDINFVCLLFNLKPEELKCCTHRQSSPKHWSY